MPILLPQMNDKVGQPYMYIPFSTTLYGYRGGVNRFIRVVDNEYGDYTTTLYYGGLGGARRVKSTIETVTLNRLFHFMSFGHTPYLEAVFSRAAQETSGIQLSDEHSVLMTQAALRNYDARAKVLLQLCKERKTLIFGANPTTSAVTGELVAELHCVLLLWERLMDMGSIHATNCLNVEEFGFRIDTRAFEDKIIQLHSRMIKTDFVDMQFKMTQEERDELFYKYGIGDLGG